MSRWWAPTEALERPDDVVKAAFIPAGDGHELSSALLGVHRAVAGAISKRVQDGLIDEHGLVDAMAGMREQVADDAVTAIGTMMDPTYAGLLVRDWCDNAEIAALSVYRSSVSKGVSSAAAAQRAAGIYGVPQGELGRYTATAADPKVQPQVLADEADRALMAHVQRISQDEREAVAKAERPFRESDVKRDELGQFARQGRAKTKPSVLDRYGVTSAIPAGLTSWVNDAVEAAQKEDAAQQQKTAEPDPAQAEREELEQRRERAQARSERKQRRERRSRRAERTRSRTRQPEERTQERTRERTRATIRSRVRQAIRQANERVPEKFKAPLDPFDPSLAKPDLMARTNVVPGSYGKLNENVSFYISGAEWKAIRGQMDEEARHRDGGPTHVARIGNIVSDVNSADVVGEDFRDQAESSRSTAAQFAIGDLERMHNLTEGSVRAYARPIDDHWDVEAAVDEAIEAKMYSGESGTVTAYEPYTPYGTVEDGPAAYVVEHMWQKDGNDDFSNVSVPTVVELIVHDASGDVVGSGSAGYRNLDPDQAYRFTTGDDRFGSVYDTNLMWDPSARVVVQRMHLFPVDDEEIQDVVKAERPFRESDVNRDELGQFAREAAAQVKLPGILERMTPQENDVERPADRERLERRERAEARARRRQRQARRTRSRSGPLTQAAEGTRERTRERTQERTRERTRERIMTRKPVARTASGARAELNLDKGSGYQTFNKEGFLKLLEQVSDEDLMALEQGGEAITLTPSMREQLFAGTESEHDVMFQMRVNVENDELKARERAFDQDHMDTDIEIALKPHIATDHRLLQATLERIFDSSPDTAIIELARQDGEITVRYSMAPAAQQYMVDIPDEIDPDKTYSLVYVGTYQLRDLYGSSQQGLRRFGGMMDEVGLDGGFVLNPSINYYRVVAPTVQRYRAEER